MIKKIISKVSKFKFRIRNKLFRSRFGQCGNNLLVYGNPRIVYGKNISIGDNVNINDNVLLNATGSMIRIGNNVTISPDVKIMAGSYNPDNFILSGNRDHIDIGGVIINDYTWICTGVIILAGVRIIGKHNIIGAGAVVTHDIVDSYSIYAGNPAKLIRSINKENETDKE